MMTDSMEEYLCVIQDLTGERPYVRAVDIARRMNYSRPSVHRAIGVLRNEGYVLEAENGKRIALSEKGLKAAEEAGIRRCFFRKILLTAGIDQSAADREASRLSRAVSHETFLALERLLKS